MSFGRLVAVATALAMVLWGAELVADEPGDDALEGGLSADELKRYRRLTRQRSGYARILLTTGFGGGLRFNNPYRLSTQLGDRGESLSLTAPYFDSGVALSFGAPNGLQHGGALHLSFALEGVSQQAVSASYIAVYRGSSPWLGYGRLGVVALTMPDFNVGGELGAGIAYFFTGALGVTAELVADLFYGAGTYDVAYSVIPIMSAHAGVVIDYEVLP